MVNYVLTYSLYKRQFSVWLIVGKEILDQQRFYTKAKTTKTECGRFDVIITAYE